MKNNFVIILVTFSSKKEAELTAGSLLKKRLVACANIIGKIGSKFWWNGRIDKANETLAIFKTSGNKFKAVEKEVKRLHSYEVPEIIAIPIIALSEDYRRWIKDSII
ncbi:MAG: divalent-cation tolerance protein CutA [Candidatus Omnitrophica bacterium]|nr:divalent-cation tolerance protein CutA [Candidatus Omnitrophota bacterium]